MAKKATPKKNVTQKVKKKPVAKKVTPKESAPTLAPKSTPKPVKKSFWRKCLKFCFTVGLWLGLAGGIVLIGLFFTLPDPTKVINEQRRPPTVTLLDRHGVPFSQLRGHAIAPARFAEMPPLLPAAFLAMEDQRFYSHFGLDPVGILRAAWRNIVAGGVREGGSTITQQIAKNLFLSPERSFFRKIQEALLALWLEQKFDKQQIIEIYLNRIYLGSGVYGIAAGAQQYFGKPFSELELAEIALLAGLPKAPSRYSPMSNPEAAQERALLVLQVLKEQEIIADTDYTAASKQLENSQDLPVRQTRGADFHRWIMQRLEGLNLLGQHDLTVHTTLNNQLQRVIEHQLQEAREAFSDENVEQAAIVSMEKNGAVRAMLGGVPWAKSQFNRATQAKRQVGSVFKIVVYASALEVGYSPNTIVELIPPKNTQQWWPEDSAQNTQDSLDLRTGMAQSSNALAVTLTRDVGRRALIKMAHRMGISSTIPNLPSIALGVAEIPLLEMTGAMAVIAADGLSAQPYGIKSVLNGDGQIVYAHDDHRHRVFSHNVAIGMQDMLAAVIDSGTGKAAQNQSTLGGKTGTTQNHRDALFIGYGTDLVTGVWLGNDNATPMKDTTGGGLPAKIFQSIAQVFPH